MTSLDTMLYLDAEYITCRDAIDKIISYCSFEEVEEYINLLRQGIDAEVRKEWLKNGISTETN